MTLLDLTIGRIIFLVEFLDKLLFGNIFIIIKVLGLFLSLIISSLLIFIWIKLENEYKDETNFWLTLIKNTKDFYFLKKAKKNFDEIKKIFHEDQNKGLIEIDNFLNFVLETFGYEGKLEEKLNQIDINLLPNLEDIKKANKIVEIIKNYLDNNKQINLSYDEYLLIFNEYEKTLFYLNVLNPEDFLVKSLK
jgi:NurA-like 5'-3' nuclease